MRQRQVSEISKRGSLPVAMLGQLSPNGEAPPARTKPLPPARKIARKPPDSSNRVAAKPGRAAERAPKVLDPFTQEIKVRS
jgi:hypothetical protein